MCLLLAIITPGQFSRRLEIESRGMPKQRNRYLALLRGILIFFVFALGPSGPEKCGGEESERAVIAEASRDTNGLLVHKVRSKRQSTTTQISLLLPDEMEKGKRYPVVYVLPVEAGSGKRWGDSLMEVKKSDLHNKHKVICVEPTFSDLPWYADHNTSTTLRQESYLLKDVVPFIDRSYPVIAEPSGRLLVGFSKSGWGAFTLLLRNPDTFGKAAAWDAPFMMQQPNKYGMGPIFGSQENFEKYQLTRLVVDKAAKFRSDVRLFHFGYGNFQTHHEQMEKLLVENKIAHHYEAGPKREHAWNSGWLAPAVAALTEP